MTTALRSPHFGAEVASRIEARGLTCREVSRGAGVPLTTLLRRLAAQRMDFTLGELHRVARMLDTTAGAIVSEFEGAQE